MFSRVGALLGRKPTSKAELSARSGKSPDGAIRMPSEGDGRYELVERQGRVAVTPDSRSQYL